MRIRYRTPSRRDAVAERRAERNPPRETGDVREPIDLDLRSAGGPHLRLEPRRGYLSWRAIDVDTGVVSGAALKTLLHRIADALPISRLHDV